MTILIILNFTGGRPLEYDRERITRLMAEVKNALQSLYELRGLEEEEFLKNRHYIASAKYNLLVAIEACIDIAYHLISRNKFRLPRDYADSFRVLNERGLIDDDLTKRLILMARFRNRLLHLYWEVDDKMIYRIISEDIKDIEEFLSRLSEVLQEGMSQ